MTAMKITHLLRTIPQEISMHSHHILKQLLFSMNLSFSIPSQREAAVNEASQFSGTFLAEKEKE